MPIAVLMSIPFVPDPAPPYDTPLTVAPGVRRLVARNPNPFTITGTSRYLLGNRDVVVVDPGPATLGADVLDRLDGPSQVRAIWITHTHVDHSPGAAPLKEATGAKTFGFGPHGSGRTAGLSAQSGFEGADWDFSPDVTVAPGDTLDTEAGDWTALHTPGHCSNHLCFLRQEDGVLLAGDHVMSMATPLVSPPDGDMAAYLAGLDLLIQAGPSMILPAHGAPIIDPIPFLQAVKAHRLAREDKVLGALRMGHEALPGLVAAVYDDVPKVMHPAAARSLLAHLIKLADEGRVIAEPELSPDAAFRVTPG